MNFFNRIRNKLMLAFMLVAIIPSLAVGIYSLQASTKTLMNKELSDQKEKIQTVKNDVKSFLSSAKADVLFLSKSPTITSLLADKDSTKKNQIDEQSYNKQLIKTLEQEFLAFSETRRIYYQIRFLNEKGQEIVRVDSDGVNKQSDQANSKIIPNNKLQNKGGRYYFEDSINLMLGEVFVSPLDLNREHGKVEVPHKPVIRYATPLFYPNSNKKAGVILTNIDAKGFLQKLGNVQLVSKDGSYFHHADPSKLWGSKKDLNTGANLLKDEPLVAKTILSKKSGIISSSGDDLLTIERTTDVLSALGNLEEKVMTFTELDVPGATPVQSWTFIASSPIGELLTNIRSFLNTFLLILIGVLIFAFILSAIMGSIITGPIIYLTDMAQKVSTGKLHYPIKVNDKGEIGQLAVAFERMRVSMVKSLERLKNHK